MNKSKNQKVVNDSKASEPSHFGIEDCKFIEISLIHNEVFSPKINAIHDLADHKDVVEAAGVQINDRVEIEYGVHIDAASLHSISDVQPLSQDCLIAPDNK